MKKNCFISFFSLLGLGLLNAQNLTSTVHNPVAGDVFTTKSFDSTAVLPKQTGSGQTWNFSNCITSTNSPVTSTYVNVASVPSASMFSGCNIVLDKGSGNYDFYQTSPSSLTLLGVKNGTSSTIVFTNPLTFITFPFSMGNSHSDLAAGNMTINTFTGTINYNWTINGTGTGNLILPGNIIVSNILQSMGSATVSQLLNVGFGNATITLNQKNYFYHSANIKQAILEITYTSSTIQIPFGTPTVQTGFNITVNNNILTGLNENNFEATFQIFPNPGKNYFNVSLTNNSKDNCTIEILNGAGIMVRKINLGNDSEINSTIDISELPDGIYMVKTNLGTRQSVRKLIKE